MNWSRTWRGYLSCPYWPGFLIVWHKVTQTGQMSAWVPTSGSVRANFPHWRLAKDSTPWVGVSGHAAEGLRGLLGLQAYYCLEGQSGQAGCASADDSAPTSQEETTGGTSTSPNRNWAVHQPPESLTFASSLFVSLAHTFLVPGSPSTICSTLLSRSDKIWEL